MVIGVQTALMSSVPASLLYFYCYQGKTHFTMLVDGVVVSGRQDETSLRDEAWRGQVHLTRTFYLIVIIVLLFCGLRFASDPFPKILDQFR